jgi:hypothetical protein
LNDLAKIRVNLFPYEISIWMATSHAVLLGSALQKFELFRNKQNAPFCVAIKKKLQVTCHGSITELVRALGHET